MSRSMIARQNIKLNLVPGGVTPVLNVSQYDSAYDVHFTLYNGAQLFEIPDDVSIQFQETKCDGNGFTVGATKSPTYTGQCYIWMQEQMSAVPGDQICELVLTNTTDDQIGTANFIMRVEPAALNKNTVISESEIAYANQVLAQLGSVAAYKAQLDAQGNEIDQLNTDLAAEVAARQAADNTLQSNINSEASTRATADAALQSQINQLVAPEGSAPSAAEVENARVGADGTVYSTLGDAIRGQVTDVKTALEAIGTVIVGTNILPPVYENGFITSTGAETSPGNAFRSKSMIPVTSGASIILMQTTDLSVIRVAEYNANQEFIQRSTVYGTTPTQLTANTKFIRVASDAFDAATAVTKNIGLAYASSVTPYAPYESGFKLSEDVQLPDYVTSDINAFKNDVNEKVSEIITEESTNLIPPVYENGFITSTGAETSTANSCRSKDYIPVVGGRSIIQMASSNTLSVIYIATYNSAKVFQSRLTVNSTQAIQLPSDIAYIRFTANGFDATAILAKDIGLAYSTHEVDYIPYALEKYLSDEVIIRGVHRHDAMRWCAMGDSITEGTYSDAQGAHVVPSETWAAITAELCQYDMTNKGIGGTGWVKKGSQGDKKNAREQVDDIDFSAYDLVTLSFGVNDWKGGVTWGTMNDSPDLGGTVYSNMKYVLRKIITDNPYAKVIVITPFNCRQGKGELATEATNYAIGYDYDGHTLQDMFDLEKEVCEYYGIQYLDMTHTSIINRLNAVTATPDAVHPSLDAHRCIAYQTANSLMYNN